MPHLTNLLTAPSARRRLSCSSLTVHTVQPHLQTDGPGAVRDLLRPGAGLDGDDVAVVLRPGAVPGQPHPEVEVTSLPLPGLLHLPRDQEEEELVIEADALRPPPPVLLVLQGVQVRRGRDGGGEVGRGLDELVVDEVLRPAVSGGEVVEDVGEREEAGTGEDRAVAQGERTGSLVLESLSPGQTDRTALALVLAVAGQLSRQSLGRQGADTAEGGPAERTGAGLAVAGVAGQVAVVTLPDPGWRTGQVTHGKLQHLPGHLHHFRGGLHSVLARPHSLRGLAPPAL